MTQGWKARQNCFRTLHPVRGYLVFLGERFPIHLGKGCHCGPHRRCKGVHHLLPLSTYICYISVQNVRLSCSPFLLYSFIHSFIHLDPGQVHQESGGYFWETVRQKGIHPALETRPSLNTMGII